MVFYATYAAQEAFVPFHDACDKAIHVLGMLSIDGHVPVFSIDNDMMQ